MPVLKREIQYQVNRRVNEIQEGLAERHIKPEVNGRVPAVFVGRVSQRKYYIGWNYQDKNKQIADYADVAHPEMFVEKPMIAWIME